MAAENALAEKAHEIGAKVAAQHAASVDKGARFPHEAIDALKKEKLLGAYIPKSLGGGGASLAEIASVCHALGQYCASTGMVYAMHQIQIACMARHYKDSAFFKKYLTECAEKELLIASATTELGPSGNTRMSSCAPEITGDQFALEKNAPVISYGIEADAVLVTSRRAPDAPNSDQIATLVPKGGYTLEKTMEWDTLGMRGTCSHGFLFKAKGNIEQILPTPFADISAQTMLPTAHVTWTALWSGIAVDAMNRARVFVRNQARSNPGVTPPSAMRLAEAMNTLHVLRANVNDGTREYERIMNDPEALSSMGFAIRMNNLKVSTTQIAVDVVGKALSICGIAGYKDNTKFSIGRHLRDVHGGALMVANDRILATNSSLLLVYKDD
jgi:acyl-CoA dehydrogenase